MIVLENIKKDMEALTIGGYNIVAAYMRGRLIWSAKIIDDILSCFYNGYWIDEYPWTDDTPWKD